MKRSQKLASIVVGLMITMFSAILFLPVSVPVDAQGGVTGYANLRVSNFYRAQPRTAITVTMNLTPLTTSGTYQRLVSAGAVSISGGAIATKPAGTVLILVNSGGQTITITETGKLKSAGNIVLGTLDSATLLSDGTNWYQIAASNN